MDKNQNNFSYEDEEKLSKLIIWMSWKFEVRAEEKYGGVSKYNVM